MPLFPTTDPVPASYRRDVDAIWKDIRALWQFSRNQAAQKTKTDREFVFSHSATPVANEVSPPYKVREPGRSVVRRMDVSARVPGSTLSEIELRKNGAKIVSLQLPSGSNTAVADGRSEIVVEGDLITVVFITVGTGLAGVVIQGSLR